LGVAGVLALSAPAVVHGQENLSLGMTAGIGSISMPGFETGITGTGEGESLSASGLGPHLGFSGGLTLGRAGSFDMSLGWSGFGTVVQRGFSQTQNLTGTGFVIISGLTTPGNSSISLATTSGGGTAGASAAVNNANPEGGTANLAVTAPAAGGVQNAAAVTPAAGGESFSYGGVATDGASGSALAFGAIGASDGGLFIASGDLTGLAITTTGSSYSFYGGADVSLAFAGVMSERVAVQAYAGPSYRFLGQHNETTISIDVPEAAPSAIEFPTYSMENDYDLDTHYLGGVLGLNASYLLNDHLILTLGGEGGVYHAVDKLRGTQRYVVGGGDNGAGPYPEQSVASTVPGLESNGMAWSARGNGLLTVLLGPNRQLSFGGTVEYLSRVANVDQQAPTVTTTGYGTGSDDGSVDYAAAGAGGASPILTFGDMWSFTGSVSLTGQF
jgi:hypothetical protein